MIFVLARMAGFEGVLNLFRYITFRSGAAVMTALVIALWLGPRFIAWLRTKQGKGQPIRADGPASHLLTKKGTPTMGGLLILVSMTISTLLWMDVSNGFTWACLLVTLGFGAIGFMDDYDKVVKRSAKGVSARARLLLEFAIAGAAVWYIGERVGHTLYLPFLKDAGAVPRPRLCAVRRVHHRGHGQCGQPDRRARRAGDDAGDHRRAEPRRDRLCRGEHPLQRLSRHPPRAGVGRARGVRRRADRRVPRLPVVQRAAGGGVHGRYGVSLALGGALGTIAVVTNHEIVLLLIGGLFVLETVSVIVQVISFKTTGKRVFKMAPLHHHYEQLGWSESTVVIRFWIVSRSCSRSPGWRR